MTSGRTATAIFLFAILSLVSRSKSCSLYINSSWTVDPDLTCTTDSDCVLINCENGLGCCYAGSCDTINYANASWTAINTHWYSTMHNSSCPNLNTCGPAPTCSTTMAQTYYVYSAACGTDLFCVKKWTLPKGYLAGIVVGTIIGIAVIAFGVMVLGAMLYKAWISRKAFEEANMLEVIPPRDPNKPIPLEE